ncbi:AfsR/SARP family transcriptional regulator [Georgenia yuyongxinii]|uniref:Response regulator receiver protein n=1 Tax=Georgenia yuyongxinii TaxID=2589797 RepID=A0A552WJX2_9MICO|nr:BTAD domain-containing putative transcriptional regulator [Georgenia yuyongxinii]TRW43058.1 response regulator receiver protein [Georgenia yuyongxinii]
MNATATSAPPTIRLTVQLFGSLQVRRGDDLLGAHQLGGAKPRQVLEILLLNLGTPVGKDRLIELLWNGCPPAEARATLESYVSVLRRQIQPGAGRQGPLRTSNGGYVLERCLVDLDVDRFDALVRLAQRSPAPVAYPALVEALEIVAGPLLADELRATWAEEARSLHATRFANALALAAETALELGALEAAAGWARRALAAEPLAENAWTVLVEALERAGRYAEGLQAYESCRRTLDRELGCAPGPRLQKAFVRLLQATADGETELSRVLSALLLLHAQLQRAAAGLPDAPAPAASLRAAGDVVGTFLRKALAEPAHRAAVGPHPVLVVT